MEERGVINVENVVEEGFCFLSLVFLVIFYWNKVYGFLKDRLFFYFFGSISIEFCFLFIKDVVRKGCVVSSVY